MSKTLLEKYNLSDKVEILMKEDHIEIKAVRPPRDGWGQAFKEMHASGDDVMLLGAITDEDILEEWDWEHETDSI